MFKIKHYLNRRRVKHQLPVIIGCIIIILGILFLLWQKGLFSSRQTTEIKPMPLPVAVSENYVAEAQIAMSDYQLFLKEKKTVIDITRRRDHLLSLIIAKEHQSLHLTLVMIGDALIAAKQGDIAEGERAKEMIASVLEYHPEFKL